MSIYDKATLVQIPSGYKASGAKLYSVLPANGDGDFTISADADATRVDQNGLVESTSANQARLSRNFIDGVVQPDPFLLLEPSRRNIFTYSEDFSSGISLPSSSVVTSNDTTSPKGDVGADKLTHSASSGAYAAKTLSMTSGTTYSVSVFAKKDDLRYLKVWVSHTFGASVATEQVTFDLDIGSVQYVGSGNDSANIIEYPNGWYRCEIVTTAGGDMGYATYFAFSEDTNTVSITGTVGSGYLFGGQVEDGGSGVDADYPTSYIPTTSAAVTRTADTVKLENFTDVPTDYPFTAFVDMDVIEDETGYGFSIIDISTSDKYWSVGYSEDSGNLGKFRFTNRAQGTSYNFNTTSTYGTGRYKIAIKFISSTNFKAFIDGVEVVDYTHTSSAFNTNINDVLLGQLRVAGDVGTRSNIHQFMVFNEALSDSELENLTSYDSFGQMAKALLYTIE